MRTDIDRELKDIDRRLKIENIESLNEANELMHDENVTITKKAFESVFVGAMSLLLVASAMVTESKVVTFSNALLLGLYSPVLWQDVIHGISDAISRKTLIKNYIKEHEEISEVIEDQEQPRSR